MVFEIIFSLCRERFGVNRSCFFVFFLWCWLGSEVGAIPIAGSNGVVVDFAGVKDASPEGLSVQIKEGGALVLIPWEKIDLAKLRESHSVISAAYFRTREGATVQLNLGSFVPAGGGPAPALPEELAAVPGRHLVELGGARFWIQLPVQGEPRAILLLAMGQDGYSFRYLGLPDRNRWREMASKFNLAVMAYSFPVPAEQVREFKSADFVFADKGSGKLLLSAIDSVAEKTGRQGLASCPLVIYGQDALGGGFAYNFLQAFPERVIAAVSVKGTFYSAPASEISAKVPFAFIWGEYDDDVKRWETEHIQEKAYRDALRLRPNWVSAMELRGAGGESPQSSHFAMTFLDRVLLARLQANGDILDIDRSRGFIGDLRELTISRMEDPTSPLDEFKTWLPDGEVGRLWEDLANGRLQIPSRSE
ncbi:MAG: hypothetical protein JNK37_11805 [Verrucomicrobiales bacterium]|nr:hypothetical protein [Verrucomicrobiales bacterium]